MIDYLVFYPLEFISRIVTSWYWRRYAGFVKMRGGNEYGG